MRRNRSPAPSFSPYRALAHHHIQGGHHVAAQGQKAPESSSSVIRSFNVESNPTRPVRPSPLTASTIPDMPLEIVDRIRSFPLFLSAPDDFLVALVRHLRPQAHAAHDLIVREGDEARAMYWLVRGVVAVTSRDGEAVYAELKPGAFFGEIGVLMDMPRTATIVARTKCLLVVLKKEDLQAELPKYPEMEKAIRQEAQERLNILKKKQQDRNGSRTVRTVSEGKTAREPVPGEVSTGEVGVIREGAVVNSKKRKSPSPGVIEDPATGGSALGSGLVNVRQTLKELPLFSELPPDILHFLGLSAQPKTYPPFTNIVRQGNPGNEIFFIVRGSVEIIHDAPNNHVQEKGTTRQSSARPRLRQGQYFGEVSSLGLSEGRTATVRSITTVECLIIGGEALAELWRRCPPRVRNQVEETARRRFQHAGEEIQMKDADNPATEEEPLPSTPIKQLLPQVTFTEPSKAASPTQQDESNSRHPGDPDPFLSVDMENLRNRRRNSLAPPTPQPETASSPFQVGGTRSHSMDVSPLRLSFSTGTCSDVEDRGRAKKARTTPRRLDGSPVGLKHDLLLPDDVLITVFQHLDIIELLRLRQVSSQWRRMLATSPKLCTHVDLSPHNRYVTDWAIVNVLAPFIGERPESIDLSNCFHITDEGFQALWQSCGKNVKAWRMRSVWEVSANQILEMSEHAKDLEEVDWSNCRKVGDNLLARVVGWVVPELPPQQPNRNVIIASSTAKPRPHKATPGNKRQQPAAAQNGTPAPAPPGTVIGCPKLKSLNLSYCKHITDRSMAHLAAHASGRLESLSLTRCTSISDAGFQAWAPYRFTALTHLCLADCTYLSDHAVVALINCATALTHLDLSFCCALSDTATEVVALRLPALQELRLAFCGSAVSDASLACIALHLNDLRGLSVRGCVRVTGVGVENVLEGCSQLRWFDVSQCKNLTSWLEGSGIRRWGSDARSHDHGGNEGGSEPVKGLVEAWQPVVSSSPPSLRAATTVPSQGNFAGVFGFGSPIAMSGAAGGTDGRPMTALNRGSGDGTTGASATTNGGGPASAQAGSILKPILPPLGIRARLSRRPVEFIVEKGANGLR